MYVKNNNLDKRNIGVSETSQKLADSSHNLWDVIYPKYNWQSTFSLTTGATERNSVALVMIQYDATVI